MAKIPKIKISGIGSIPSGYMLGRTSSGVGDVELLSPTHVAHAVARTGVVSTPGAPSNVTGTTNRISVINDVIDIDAAYVGQASLTTLGTITTGTWNAGAVTTATLTDSTLTPGSVVFAGTAGLLTQDNTNLFWDNTNKALNIGPNFQFSTLNVTSSIVETYPAFIRGIKADTRLGIDNGTAVSVSNTSGIDLRVNSSTADRTAAILQASLSTTTDATRVGLLTVNLPVSGALAEHVRFNNLQVIFGNASPVSIGLGMTPTYILDVQGNTAGGTQTIRLADTTTGNTNINIIEVISSRNDGNTTFESRIAMGNRRTDGTAQASGAALGAFVFGGQWGTDTSFQAAKVLYPASIKGIAEGNYTAANAMPTGLAFFTGSTGDDIRSANLTYGTERMRIDNTGKVGVGTANPATTLDVVGPVKTLGYTVATLPTPAAGIQGARAYVTNANAPTFGAVVAGGGAVVIPVFCDGTNWIVG